MQSNENLSGCLKELGIRRASAPFADRNDLTCALRALGMEQEKIECVEKSFAQGSKECALNLIRKFRMGELEKIHEAKEKLYCIDFLIKQFEQI